MITLGVLKGVQRELLRGGRWQYYFRISMKNFQCRALLLQTKSLVRGNPLPLPRLPPLLHVLVCSAYVLINFSLICLVGSEVLNNRNIGID